MGSGDAGGELVHDAARPTAVAGGRAVPGEALDAPAPGVVAPARALVLPFPLPLAVG
ncbi:hypothetical protein ACF059_21375 [Streptomyces sp. NPDC016562]|uniref:hypothetical protein n=1 Tax=Streptomyces sp. NPDC016562 TaxID=3364966 RepID=UPI0036FE4621